MREEIAPRSWIDDEDWTIPADRAGADLDSWATEADDWPPPLESDEDRFPYPAGLP